MKKYILFISGLFTIGLTSYFSLLPLNWVSQADISGLYTTPITPAGFTFSIWSLIYASWIVLGIYIIIKQPKIKKSLRYRLAAAQILSALWLIPWHYQYILVSFIVMLIIFILLWKIMSYKKMQNMWFSYTVSLFFGWIAIASILNFNITLIAYNLYAFPTFISALSIWVGIAISTYWIYKKQNYIPLLILIWAIIGIMLK